VEARGDGIIIAGVITTWRGRCPLSIGAVVAEAAVGEAEQARMTVVRRMTMSQTLPPGAAAADTSCRGRSRSNSLRTSSGEGKQRWVVSDSEFEDARNLAMAAADGNKDDGKNNRNDDDDRRTSSTWSNFIVRILFLTLLLLAYSKLY
jgi:hypothetical protein